MKNFRISARLRLARIKIKKPFRFVGKHPYIYGTILFVFILAVAATLPLSDANNGDGEQDVILQYKTSSIADLDKAREEAESNGKKLKYIDLTKNPPAIIQGPTTK